MKYLKLTGLFGLVFLASSSFADVTFNVTFLTDKADKTIQYELLGPWYRDSKVQNASTCATAPYYAQENALSFLGKWTLEINPNGPQNDDTTKHFNVDFSKGMINLVISEYRNGGFALAIQNLPDAK